jgi:hypothetical protein
MRREAQIDKYTLFDRIGYKPHSQEQKLIHDSTARFIIPCCGRRFGKSQSVGHEMTYNLFIPETMNWICGPTYKLGEKEFRVVWDDLKKLKILDKCSTKSYNVNQGQMRIVTPMGSILEVVSAEKQDGLVGEGLDSIIMSEAAKHSMRTWQMYIEPALSDKRGCAYFPSTPQGYNWYKGLYDMGQHPDYPDYESWRFPTWMNKAMYPNGFDDPELTRIRANVSKQYWDQEYAAEFTSFEGQIYPEFDEKIHVRSLEYIPGWRNFQVFDFGYIDPFVCLDIMVDEMDNVYVWREYQVSHEATWTHANIIKNRDNPVGFHVDSRFGDPSGADEIATLELVIGHVFAERVEWTQGIEAVKRWLKPFEGPPKLFIDSSCMHLIRQMSQLHKKEVKEDRNERPGQHDFDDHGCDALRYFFSQFFVLGRSMSLESVYTGNYRHSEAATFFRYSSGIELNDSISYG